MKLNQKRGGVLLSYGQMVSNVLIKFLYTPFLLRSLGQNEYGLFSLIMSIVGYLAILDMGFGSTVTRYTVKYKTEGETENLYRLYSTLSVIYVVIGLLALAICVILNISSPYLFSDTMTAGEISKIRLMIVLCGINLLFSFPLQISRSVLVAYERFIFKNGIDLLKIYLQPLTMVLLIYLVNIKSVGAIIVVTIFNLLAYLIYYIYAVRKLDFKVDLKYFSPKIIPMLLTFSVWMFFVMIFEHLQYNSGQFVLGLFQDSATIAVWGIAMIFILNYRALSTAISNVYLPTFVSCGVTNNTTILREVIFKMTRYQSIILIAILLNFILFGSYFLDLWAGTTYNEAYTVCIIIMIPMFFGLILDFSYLYQIATNDLSYRVVTLFSGYIVSFIIVYFFSGITLRTYAIIIALSMIFGQIIMPLFYIRRNIDIDLKSYFLRLFRIVIIPIILTIIAFVIFNKMGDFTVFSFIISIIIYNLLLIVTLFLFGLENKEKSQVINKLKSFLIP